MAYEGTVVSVGRSQDEIRRLLAKAGSRWLRCDDDWGISPPVSICEFSAYEHHIRLRVRHRELKDQIVERRAKAQRRSVGVVEMRMREDERMRIWRVIVWHIKTRLEAVDEELESFEQAFMPHIVDPITGGTLWEFAGQAYESGAMRIDGPGLQSLLALPAPGVP